MRQRKLPFTGGTFWSGLPDKTLVKEEHCRSHASNSKGLMGEMLQRMTQSPNENFMQAIFDMQSKRAQGSAE